MTNESIGAIIKTHQTQGGNIMENIITAFEQFNKLANNTSFTGMVQPFAEVDTLTPAQVNAVLSDVESVKEYAERYIKALEELLYSLIPSPYGGYTKNSVDTIGGYIAQGFSAEEAVKVRQYDILWNKWIDHEATAKEIGEMNSLQEELEL